MLFGDIGYVDGYGRSNKQIFGFFLALSYIHRSSICSLISFRLLVMMDVAENLYENYACRYKAVIVIMIIAPLFAYIFHISALLVCVRNAVIQCYLALLCNSDCCDDKSRKKVSVICSITGLLLLAVLVCIY